VTESDVLRSPGSLRLTLRRMLVFGTEASLDLSSSVRASVVVYSTVADTCWCRKRDAEVDEV